MKYNLSEISEIIRDRRTIFPEQFSDRKVHKEQVELILNNALWAPTHGNTQPWFFKVFMEDGRKKLSDFLVQSFLEMDPENATKTVKLSRMKERPLQASAIVAVCMIRDPKEIIKEIEEIEAVACSIQNMHLTCTAYGLGGFWATPGVIYTPAMNDFLGLGTSDKCIGLFYIGYPAIEWPKAHRKPLEYKSEWITR